MTISFKKWVSPKTGEVRVYVSAFHERSLAAAHGSFFTADPETGKIVRHFKPCFSGRYGEATAEVMKDFDLTDCTFADLLDRMDNAQTKGGNFSEARYFANLRKQEAA